MQMRPVLFAVGLMSVMVGIAMIPSALIDYFDGSEQWPVFAMSSFGSIFIGACLAIMSRGDEDRTGQREAFLLTVLVWLVLPAIGTIPLVASGMSLTDGMFESMSGLTTTGATVLTGLDDLPRGLLLWRAILQWIGGIGIIVTALAILPGLRVGGMQILQIESSDVSGKFLPRVTEIAMQTGIVYLLATSLCAILYFVSGMVPFDAIAHAMTTLSAGGYSTHDASFGFYADTPAIYVAIVFMIVAGLPFSLLVLTILHGRFRAILRDPQPRLFISFAIFFSVLIVGYHELEISPASFETRVQGFREAFFNIISIMTGTGYASASYDLWGEPIIIIFLLSMFLGGCAGSAACGIKMFRIEITIKAIFAYAQRMIRPHSVAPVRYGGRVVDGDTLQSVMVFVFLYIATFMVGAVLLSLTGLDPLTAISGAATTVSNVGPGLGPMIGPDGTFQQLGDAAKWVCISLMLLGRLEFIAVFVVLSRRFWKG